MSQPDFYSVQEWLEAKSPPDKSFVARRKFATSAEFLDFSLEQWCNKAIAAGCMQIKQLAKYYCQENSATESYCIVARNDLVFGTAWVYEEGPHSFTVVSESEHNFVEIMVSAIITLHSKEQNG